MAERRKGGDSRGRDRHIVIVWEITEGMGIIKTKQRVGSELLFPAVRYGPLITMENPTCYFAHFSSTVPEEFRETL